jgi:hypothetical protein
MAHCFVMKVLLRHAESRLYYAANDRWVTYPAKAHDFEDVDLAIGAAVREQLPEMEVVLSFDCPPGELRLPVGAKGARKQARSAVSECLLPDALCRTE